MKKILYVATVVKKHIMEFHIPYLKMLKAEGWETAVAARNDYENPEDCVIPFCDTYFNIPFERNPFHPQNVKAYRELKKIIDIGNYDIIHCHTPVGGFLGRLAAIPSRKRGTKVFYTAHGFHFFKGAPIKNWVLYYPAEKLLSYWTDVLITINKEDYALAQNKMGAKKIEYVPGVGIDLEKFKPNILSENERVELRASLGVTSNQKMLLSVGELIARKDHETAIRAVAKLADKRIKYFICGSGELENYLTELIKKLGMTDSIKLLGYRHDISSLCECADLFLFPSLQEGLPVALMEAIASKTPVICSNIRGNIDIVDENNLFETKDINGLSYMINEYILSTDLKKISNNFNRLKKFDLLTVEKEIAKIYQRGGVKHLSDLLRLQTLRLSLGIPLDTFVILSVGELNKNKNHEIIIQAIANLRNKNVHYIIAGEGELKGYLLDLSQKYNISNQVHLLGYRKDVVDLYHIADLYAHPSLREGLPVAVMEALASGLPVACSRIRGNIDLIENGKNGVFFNSQCLMDTRDLLDKALKKEFNYMKSTNQKENIIFDLDEIKFQIYNLYNCESMF